MISGFQARVLAWMQRCFRTQDAFSLQQRSFRFLEEALELVQAAGTSEADARRLVAYVYGRPRGEISQEIGGVMVTLAGLAAADGWQMDECGENELARCDRNTEAIRAKDLAKPARSSLPQVVAGPRVMGVGRDAGDERCLGVYFSRRPTDDDMRAFHDSIRSS